MYPKTQKETEKEAWAECVKAIDVANRALSHKRGKDHLVITYICQLLEFLGSTTDIIYYYNYKFMYIIILITLQ